MRKREHTPCAHQGVADHFMRSPRRLAAGPEADQQTRDDLGRDVQRCVANPPLRLVRPRPCHDRSILKRRESEDGQVKNLLP